MKKINLIIILIILAVAVFFGLRFLGGDEDNSQIFTTVKGNSDIIRITKPLPNATISTPLEIEGEARGTWYFEASFPIKLLDEKGRELTTVVAQAQPDPATGEINWMTENFVPFKAIIDFAAANDTKAILAFIKDNPSGLAEHDDRLEIPITLQKSELMTVKLFFNNNKLDPEFSCNKVFSVERIIAKTQAPARAALGLLLKGKLANEEINSGFSTSINQGVKIQKLTIENGIAKVDFDEQLQFQVGGSCRVAAIRAQITETLKQFPTVKEVIISINGRTEDILQP